MKVLQGLLALIAVLVVGAVGYGFSLPQQAHLERSIVIARAPATVFGVLNSYRDFAAWSPWAGLDPAMQVRIEGPTQGVGARYYWSSAQDSVGSGSQEIVESVPHSLIRVALTFSGMDSKNHASYLLTPDGASTRLVWTHDADFGGNLLGRYFGLLLDGMVGADYERGLAQLKAYVEALPADAAGAPATQPEAPASAQ